jgi:hypothetical protein
MPKFNPSAVERGVFDMIAFETRAIPDKVVVRPSPLNKGEFVVEVVMDARKVRAKKKFEKELTMILPGNYELSLEWSGEE